MSKGKKEQPIPASQGVQQDWAALSEMHQNCAAYAIIPMALGSYFRDRELCSRVPDQDGLLKNALILKKDVEEYTQRLMGIYQRHANRSGPVTTPDENMLMVQLWEEYISWASSYDAVVLPTMEAILDAFQSADIAVDVQRPTPLSNSLS